MRRIIIKTAFKRSFPLWIWLFSLICPGTGHAVEFWEHVTGEKTKWLTFNVFCQKIGDAPLPAQEEIFVSPYYTSPIFTKDHELANSVYLLLSYKSGCALSDYSDRNHYIAFPLSENDPLSIERCTVIRCVTKAGVYTDGPTDPAEVGDAAEYFYRYDTIALTKLLQKGKDTIHSSEKGVYFVYWLEPAVKANIKDMPSEYGSRSQVTAEAVCDLSGLTDAVKPPHIPWRYSIGNGPQQYLSTRGDTKISFGMQDLNGAKPGDNILLEAGSSSDNKNRKVIRFYPELPRVVIHSQTIPPTDSLLRYLDVHLAFPLDAGKQEKFTTLTCYKSISMREDGVFNISESEVLFQTDVSRLITKAGKTSIPIPDGKQLSPGTYYITIEGSVKGRSNHPDRNGHLYSPATLNAMFPCLRFMVKQNTLSISDLTITQPKCPKQKGGISFNYTKRAIDGGKNHYAVYEFIDDDWQISPIFDIRVTSGTWGTAVNVKSDSVPQGEHHFAFRYYTGDNLNAQYEFDGSIPVVSPIELTIQKKDISGTIVENGQNKTSEDGHIVIRRDWIRNGTPPYTVSYGTLNAQGMSPGSPKPFPHDTLHIPKAGHYYFGVSDANLCLTTVKAEIKVLDNRLGVSVQEQSPVSCHGANDGVLQAVPIGTVDEKFLDFTWKTLNGTVGNEATLGQVRPNTAYAVEVRHRLLPQLKTTASAILTEPEPFSIAVSSVTDVKCYGQRTGAAVFLVNGGTPPLNGFWDNFTDGFKIENVAAGRYKLKVFDTRGCTADYMAYIRQPDAPLRIVLDSLRHVHYDSRGQMQLGYFDAHAEGGTPPLSRVSCQTFGLPQTNKLGGRYPLFAGDANGCTVDTTITVESYDRLGATIVKTHEVSCFNGFDGACALLIRGGNPPFDVRWSNGDTTRGLTDVPAGTYRAVITDATGCRTTAEVIFNEPAPITADSLRVEPPAYAGYRNGVLPAVAADGRITAIIKGGTPPYQYAWTHLQSMMVRYTEIPILEQAASGTYRLTVFDARDCFAAFDIEVPAVAPLHAVLETTAEIACQGERTGGLRARTTGGTPPYRYAWHVSDHPAESVRTAILAGTGDALDSLPAGHYEVTVTDAAGVTSTATLSLTEPERLRLTVTAVQAASYGGSVDGVSPAATRDGVIEVSLSGGSGLKRLLWMDGNGGVWQATETENGRASRRDLGGGLYRVLAEDTRGCRDSIDVSVPQPAPLACTVRQADSIRCQGGREATAIATVTGGEPPYRYRFRYDETATTDEHATDLKSESDTDGQGGAELVFPMLWKLRAGDYTFYVTDKNGMESRFRFHIPEPEALQGALRLSPSPCHEPEAGVAAAEIRGGTPPYAYRWLYNGLERIEKNSDLDGLGDGRVEVRVLDRNGCALVLNDRIDKPEPLTVWANVSEETYAGSQYGHRPLPARDGMVQLDARGGTPPYRYAWAILEQTGGRQALPDTTALMEGLAAGRYGYRVTDRHGCGYEGVTEVVKTPDLTSHIALRGLIGCADSRDGVLQAVVQGGTPPYRYDWQRDGQALGRQAGATADSLDEGRYLLTVTDAKGVVSADSFYLAAPRPLTATVQTMAVSGYGAVDGHIDWQITGGRSPHTAVWQAADPTQEAPMQAAWQPVDPRLAGLRTWEGDLPDSLRSGIYRLTLTDSSGCRFEKTYTVESPDSLSLSNLHVLHCQGEKAFLADSFRSEDNGRIRAYLSGGVPPYDIVWRDTTGKAVAAFEAAEGGDVGISDLPAGRYALQATDAHGYGLSHDVDVELSTEVRVLLEETASIPCHGDSGVLAVLADGGKAPYVYRWYRILQEGQAVSAAMEDAAREDAAARAEESDARREVALPLQSAVSPPLPAGFYRVEIEDVYGVVASDSLFLNEPEPLRLAADLQPWTAETPDTLSSAPAGRLHPNPTGGCPPYRYDWAHGDTNDRIAYRHGGHYAVTVYDRHACAVRGEFPFDGQADFEARISCTQPVSCHGEADGALSVEILGGQPPYRVLWQHGDTGVLCTHLPADLYRLSVIDADGRTCAASFNLTEPEPLTSRILPTMPRCAGRGDGSLSAEVSGGSYPYRHQWQDGPETAVYHGLAVGSYHLTVTDRNGCLLKDSVTLNEPEPLQPVLAAHQPICPEDSGRLYAEATGGTPPYRFQWHHTAYTSSADRIQNARTGHYLLSVTDSLLCRADTNVTLVQAAPLTWRPFETQYLCAGQTTLLRPAFTGDSTDIIGFWRLPDGSLSSGLEAESGQDGLHRLTIVQYGVCRYQDEVRLTVVDDTVSCLFWISTQLRVGETVTAADVSYPPADSVHWTLPPEAEPLYAEGPYAEFRFLDTGTFAVTLTSFRGLCAQSKTTTVDVLPAGGFKQVRRETETPFRDLTAAPNPAKGHTQIAFDLKKQADVAYALIEAASGRICQRGNRQMPDGRNILHLNLPEQAGLYILVLHAENTTKSLKIIVSRH